jgi:hypothetical protein
MVARVVNSIDKVKALAYPVLLAVLGWQFMSINSKIDMLMNKVDKIAAYNNYLKGKSGDTNLISKTKRSHVILYGKKEEIYNFDDYVTN